MKLVRDLERRLEALLDGMASRVFRGPLHPVELGDRLIREADLSLVDREVGPVVANSYRLQASPHDVDAAALDVLAGELERFLEEAARERGWRLEGPARVVISLDRELPQGTTRWSAEVQPGPRPPWATLIGSSRIPVTVNRSVLGRGSQADVVLGDDRTSRRHALLWEEGGRARIRDLGSANGTSVDGQPVGRAPADLQPGSVLKLGSVSYRFEPD